MLNSRSSRSSARDLRREEKRRDSMTARPIQLDREPRTPALSAYPRVYLPTVTGDSREHPLFTILRIRTTKAIESHLKERKDAKDACLMARWRIPIYCKLARQLVGLAARSTTNAGTRSPRPPEARLLPASGSRRGLQQYFISLRFPWRLARAAHNDAR